MKMFESITGAIFRGMDLGFNPLLGIGSPWVGGVLTLIVLGIIYSALLTAIYHFLMDKAHYKQLKTKLKELNKKAKKKKEIGKPEESLKIMKESTKYQMELFNLQFKPMLVSFILVILILPWVPHHFDNVVDLKPDNTGYTGEFSYREINAPVRVNDDKISINGKEYGLNDYVELDGSKWIISGLNIGEEAATVKISLVFISLPFSLPVVGSSLEALGFFILFILIVSYAFRRIMGIN